MTTTAITPPLVIGQPAFRAESRTLANAVSWVAKHIPNRPIIPVTGGILLEVGEGRLTVSGFDYDIATRTTVDITGDTRGRALVSGRLLAELVKTFPDKPVDVSTDDAVMTVRCGGVKLTLPLMPVADYPTLPDLPAASGTIPAAELAALITRVGLAADHNGSGGLKAFGGIFLTFGPNLVEAMATNRYRAAIGTTRWEPASGDTAEALAPAGALIEAARSLNGPGDITISVDGSLIGLAGPDRSITLRLLAEQFPVAPMRSAVPGRSERPAVVSVAALTLALKRADLARGAKLAPVQLTFTADQVTVSAKGEDAETGEVIDSAYDGEEITVGINPQYLAEALAGLRSDTAELSMTEPMRPVLVTSPDDKGQTYSHAVVPIRSL